MQYTEAMKKILVSMLISVGCLLASAQTMQLMQWNFFLENGLLTFENGKLRIHYDMYHEVVAKLLAKVLEVQYAGDKAGADRFIDQYTVWKDELHGVVAKNIREQSRYRFRLFKYAALGE